MIISQSLRIFFWAAFLFVFWLSNRMLLLLLWMVLLVISWFKLLLIYISWSARKFIRGSSSTSESSLSISESNYISSNSSLVCLLHRVYFPQTKQSAIFSKIFVMKNWSQNNELFLHNYLWLLYILWKPNHLAQFGIIILLLGHRIFMRYIESINK